MKSIGQGQENQTEANKKPKGRLRRLFSNTRGYLRLCLVIGFWFIALCLNLIVIMFIAELVAPKYVHIFNYVLTDKTFTELVKNHRYHAAISLLELKENAVMDEDDFYRFRTELADCYVHTGDYTKALEQYRLMHETIDYRFDTEEPEDISGEEFLMFKTFSDAALAKEEFRIYLKMGDKSNILYQYKILKEKQDSIDWETLTQMLASYAEESDEGESFNPDFDYKNGFTLELIQGRYITEPDSAIAQMEEYTINTANSRKNNPGFKLKLFNELIRMLLEQGQTIAARHYLEHALNIVDGLEYETLIYPFLGDLSEYCYQLNDIQNGKRLLKKYLTHIDDTYDPSDLDYALAHAMEFKYQQRDGNWEELIPKVVEASQSMKKQIAKNFTGMTAAQREYFIDQFKPLFSYTNDLLHQHPSDELAKLCFENNMFLRGLLLRSETSLQNSIAAMEDNELLEKYNQYVALSQELVARQYISGPGNLLKKSQIEKKVSTLETELASKSRDFRRDNEKTLTDIKSLKKSLSDKDVAMQIVQSSGNYYALILEKDGKVSYINLGAVKDLNENLGLGNNASIYSDPSTHAKWLSKLSPILEGKNVYYTSEGIFNKIALTALPIEDNGKTLGDIARVNLAGSLADIPSIKDNEKTMDLMAKNVVLWGGIDYATKESKGGENTVLGLLRQYFEETDYDEIPDIREMMRDTINANNSELDIKELDFNLTSPSNGYRGISNTTPINVSANTLTTNETTGEVVNIDNTANTSSITESKITSNHNPLEPIFRGSELRYLPGSEAEVKDIAQMLRNYGSHPILYTGSKATEKSLTSRSHKKDYILHISTHGFFHDSEAFINPMQNAGLLLANSQDYWMNDSLMLTNINEDDGILRADEIAKLDLTGCRLVVLSACQTGLGESNIEGVYGLQRAFKLAGVESILMSLWNVDDQSTHKLMTLFYSELISGKSPNLALSNAQNIMRREGYSPDKWAGFILLN